MRILGNHVGYLAAALIVAYLNLPTWRKSFLASTATIVVATLTYYGIIAVLGISGLAFAEDAAHIAQGVALWSIVGVACGLFSATTMYFTRFGKSVSLRWGTLLATYVMMLGVIYRFEVLRVLTLKASLGAVEREYLTGWIGANNYQADMFGIGFAVVFVTFLLVVAARQLKKTG
jgi:hypothetical protein